jgi:hypothetical protein
MKIDNVALEIAKLTGISEAAVRTDFKRKGRSLKKLMDIHLFLCERIGKPKPKPKSKLLVDVFRDTGLGYTKPTNLANLAK